MPEWNEEPARPLAVLARRALTPAGVFLCLVALTVLLFALPVLGRLGAACVGACVRDFRLYVWSMDWLPHAMSNGLDPFRTDLLWAPGGTNLTWVTTLPAPAFAMLPITLTAGPVAAANLLLLLAPPLAGWAMFLVCREITGHPLSAAFGALVFAFSTYVGQLMRAQLNLLLMFWFPLAVYLFLRFFRERISRRRFVTLLSLVLLGEFLTSTEVFAMMTFASGIAWLIFYVVGSKEVRSRLLDTLTPLATAFAATAVALAPILIRTLEATPTVVLRPTEQNSADLLGPLVPGFSTWLGSDAVAGLWSRFLDPDNFSYIGLPFFAIVAAFAIQARRRPGTRILVGLFGLFVVLSMGPRLHIFGERGLWLPGYALNYLPLIQHAVPVRYVLYAWFALALIVALWLAEERTRPWRYALVLIAVVAVFPAQRSVRDTEPVYHGMVTVPTFFAGGGAERAIAEDAIVLAIPRRVGEEMLWQSAADMHFRLASAYIGPTKPKNGLGNLSQEGPPPELTDFVRELERSRVELIVAAAPLSPEWGAFLEEASGSTPLMTEGVALYEVRFRPPAA